MKQQGVRIETEIETGMAPFDIVLSWDGPDQKQKTLVVEIDGSHHYYSARDQILNQRTDFKYRIFDLYKLDYHKLECWDFIIQNEAQ